MWSDDCIVLEGRPRESARLPFSRRPSAFGGMRVPRCELFSQTLGSPLPHVRSVVGQRHRSPISQGRTRH